MSKLLLAFVKISGFLPALLFFKPRVFYVNKAAQSKHINKPAILVSNHKALLDLVLYLVLFPFRIIRFLVAEVMFNKGKVFAWFLKMLGFIRVDRDSYDFDFIEISVDILQKGGIVGVFPESKLPLVKGQMSPFKPSTVLIALNSGAPIVPLYTDGNYGLFRRVNIVIGERIYLNELYDKNAPEKQEIERLNLYLQEEILKLEKFCKQKTKR